MGLIQPVPHGHIHDRLVEQIVVEGKAEMINGAASAADHGEIVSVLLPVPLVRVQD